MLFLQHLDSNRWKLRRRTQAHAAEFEQVEVRSESGEAIVVQARNLNLNIGGKPLKSRKCAFLIAGVDPELALESLASFQSRNQCMLL